MGFQKGFDPLVILIAVAVILGAVLVMVAMMACLNLFMEDGGTVVSERETKDMKKAVLAASQRLPRVPLRSCAVQYTPGAPTARWSVPARAPRMCCWQR